MNTALRFRLTFNNELEFINNTLSLVPVSHCSWDSSEMIKVSECTKAWSFCVAIYWCRMCEPVCVDWLEHEWVLPIRSLYERWRSGLGDWQQCSAKHCWTSCKWEPRAVNHCEVKASQVSEVCHEHFKIWCWSFWWMEFESDLITI